MSEAREYLVEQARIPTRGEEDSEIRDTAQALLVMYDAGMLETTQEEGSGEFLFTYKNNVTDEQVSAAQSAFEVLGTCDNDALEAYYTGEAS